MTNSLDDETRRLLASVGIDVEMKSDDDGKASDSAAARGGKDDGKDDGKGDAARAFSEKPKKRRGSALLWESCLSRPLLAGALLGSSLLGSSLLIGVFFQKTFYSKNIGRYESIRFCDEPASGVAALFCAEAADQISKDQISKDQISWAEAAPSESLSDDMYSMQKKPQLLDCLQQMNRRDALLRRRGAALVDQVALAQRSYNPLALIPLREEIDQFIRADLRTGASLSAMAAAASFPLHPAGPMRQKSEDLESIGVFPENLEAYCSIASRAKRITSRIDQAIEIIGESDGDLLLCAKTVAASLNMLDDLVFEAQDAKTQLSCSLVRIADLRFRIFDAARSAVEQAFERLLQSGGKDLAPVQLVEKEASLLNEIQGVHLLLDRMSLKEDQNRLHSIERLCEELLCQIRAQRCNKLIIEPCSVLGSGLENPAPWRCSESIFYSVDRFCF